MSDDRLALRQLQPEVLALPPRPRNAATDQPLRPELRHIALQDTRVRHLDARDRPAEGALAQTGDGDGDFGELGPGMRRFGADARSSSCAGSA
jgi:hypothetical protein